MQIMVLKYGLKNLFLLYQIRLITARLELSTIHPGTSIFTEETTTSVPSLEGTIDCLLIKFNKGSGRVSTRFSEIHSRRIVLFNFLVNKEVSQ